ncbi:MAG TPA: cyclic nucleotide-binding domain-containing protein [Anaeromyxobacteraceae bacterium]|nr:cyclic nucleotide-binding domain-containing protein [Anaeromyxobacteraceae bacterium]
MSWFEAAGYLASVLVFSTFYMKTMVPLRCVAIASNVAFIVYGLFGGLHPVLALHLLLLPLNVVRLVQVRRLAIRIREAVGADPSLEALAPLLEKRTFERGAVLFRKGDPASTLHVLVRGDIRLPELGITLRDRGTVVGEIGIFSPFHQRTASAICETEVETLTLGEAEVVRHYFRDPRFGLSLARLMVRRLLTVPAHAAAGEVPGAAMRERA